MTLLLDAAALIALERDERAMWVRLKASHVGGEVPVTHAGVVAQVWRGGARQARLALALGGVDVRALDEPLGRATGRLLGLTATTDVVDAALVLLARDGDDIVTGDLEDLRTLASVAGRDVELVRP